MRRFVAICSAAAMLALPVVAFATDAQPAPQQKKGKVVAELKVIESAIVKAVDLKKRTVTVEKADGSQQTFVLDNRVKKLDQVQVGDMVKASYYEAVTVRLKKTKATPSISLDESATRDPASVKPSGTAKRQVTVIATIDKILDNGTAVTLRSPNGTTMDVKVKNPENLAKIKKGEVKEGDQVEITYTQALAVSVEKVSQPEKK
ncbi:MAG TPA: hypothetical protein VIU41_06600 [Geobacteraceae bacterium]